MHVKVATLQTANAIDDLSYGFLDNGGTLTYLGHWTFGMPDATTTGLEGLPVFDMPKDATPRVRRDVIAANGLMVVQPRKVFEAFKEARAISLTMADEAQVLSGKGYRSDALIERMAPRVKVALRALDEQGAIVMAADQRCDELHAECVSDFPDDGETELQRVMFDSAIVARMEPLGSVERQQFAEGIVPKRFDDARMIAALLRTPHAMHGIDAASMVLIQDAYARVARPNTAVAIGVLRDMTKAARLAAAGAVASLVPVSGMPPDQCFGSLLRSGEYLAAVRQLVATKPEPIDYQARNAASAA